VSKDGKDSGDRSLERRLLDTAEKVNAPDSFFAAHSLKLLELAEDGLGDRLPESLSIVELLSVLSQGLADIAAWATITSRAAQGEQLQGETAAEISALLTKTLGATAAAYGAVSATYQTYVRATEET
jgi:hypothetical protein